MNEGTKIFQTQFGYNHAGICIPNSCSEHDVRIQLAKDNILGLVESSVVGWDSTLHINLVRGCQAETDEQELTPGDKGFM